MIEEMYEGELTDEQKFDMLRVTFLDERWPTKLHHTPQIEAAYRCWLATDCAHDEEPQIRKKAIRGSGVQYVRVCIDCGFQHGGPIAKKDIPSLDDVPELGGLSAETFFRRRWESWRDQKIEFWENQDSKVSEEYASYLKSPEWKSKRNKVLLRAQGICEGCRDANATQVHHISYAHRFEEFLWELVAICEPCHTRAHPEKQGKVLGDD